MWQWFKQHAQVLGLLAGGMALVLAAIGHVVVEPPREFIWAVFVVGALLVVFSLWSLLRESRISLRSLRDQPFLLVKQGITHWRLLDSEDMGTVELVGWSLCYRSREPMTIQVKVVCYTAAGHPSVGSFQTRGPQVLTLKKGQTFLPIISCQCGPFLDAGAYSGLGAKLWLISEGESGCWSEWLPTPPQSTGDA